MYIVGAPYRHVCGFKNGFPIYEITAIKEIHKDGYLVLENNARICFEPVGRLDPDPRLSKQ